MILVKNNVQFEITGNGRVIATTEGISESKVGRVAAYDTEYTIVYPRIEFRVGPPPWLTDRADSKGWALDDYEGEEEITRPLDWCEFAVTEEEVAAIKQLITEFKAQPKPSAWLDYYGRKVFVYNRGQITEYADGFGCAYECVSVGKPYQALTDIGHEHVTLDECKAAIDRANLDQGVRLSGFSALSYQEAKAQGVGATWRKPFGDETLTVVAVRPNYILSSLHGLIYLSMGEAHCEYVCKLGQEHAFIQRFEAPADDGEKRCHYCGQPASKINFFDVWVCENCR